MFRILLVNHILLHYIWSQTLFQWAFWAECFNLRFIYPWSQHWLPIYNWSSRSYHYDIRLSLNILKLRLCRNNVFFHHFNIHFVIKANNVFLFIILNKNFEINVWNMFFIFENISIFIDYNIESNLLYWLYFTNTIDSTHCELV